MERTLRILKRNSECNSGEVESKNGFEKHHSARVGSRSWDLLRGVGKVKLVRERRNETLLYTLGT